MQELIFAILEGKIWRKSV